MVQNADGMTGLVRTSKLKNTPSNTTNSLKSSSYLHKGDERRDTYSFLSDQEIESLHARYIELALSLENLAKKNQSLSSETTKTINQLKQKLKEETEKRLYLEKLILEMSKKIGFSDPYLDKINKN